MKQICNTGELWSTQRWTKQNIKSNWSEGGINISVSISAGQKCHRWERDYSPVITNTTNNNSWNNSCISVYILSLHLWTKKKQVCFHSTVPPVRIMPGKNALRCWTMSKFINFKFYCHTSTSASVLQTNTFLLGAAWLPLTCRSWMTSPPGVTSSLLSGPVRETKTTTKKKQHTHPHLDPRDADRGRNHKFR